MGNIVGMSGAGHGPLLGNDLQANLPEAKRTSGRNTPRMLRTADGAHAGFECSIGFKCGDLGGGRRRGMLHSKMPQREDKS